MCSERILKMPKIDLHCHLDGSLTREAVCEITGRRVSIEELQTGMECGSLSEYLKKFELPLTCLQTAAMGFLEIPS